MPVRAPGPTGRSQRALAPAAQDTISRRRFLQATGALGAGAAAWLAAGCGDDDTPARTLRMAQSGDLNLVGYPFAFASGNRILAYAASEPLVQYVDSLTPQLVLAERLDVSQDFRRAVVTVRKGAEFHNGAPVTSEDVAFSVRTVKDPTAAGLPSTMQFELGSFARSISEINVTDDRTVEFTLEQPRTNLMDFFAQLHIAQQESFAGIAQGKVVGTGPFKLKHWDEGRAYQLERFANWHSTGSARRPYLDGIEVSILPDQATAVIAFDGGNLDAYLAVGAPNAARFRASGRTRFTGKTGMNYLGMNVTNPVLQDARVRQAIFYAIDRDRMLRDAGHEFGHVTTQPWAATSPAFDPTREAALYDPQRAAALLSQAGYQPDRELVIEYAAGLALHELQAQLIQSDLQAVGFATRLDGVESGRYQVRYRAGEFPDFWLAAHLSGDLTPLTLFQQTFEFVPDRNICHYSNARYSDLVTQLAGVAPDSSAAKDIYRQLNQIMLEDPFVIPTGIPQVRIDLVQDHVQGWPSRAEEYAITVAGEVNLAEVRLQ